MKTTDFIVETSLIAQEADVMHADHEVQMARSDCYNAAKYAIELHRMLKKLSEQQGLDGWVSEKITLANDYLRTVHEYLSHEMLHGEEEMIAFSEGAANYALDIMINEEFSQKDIDSAIGDFVRSGGEIKKGKPSKVPRRAGLSLASKHIGGHGDKMKPSRTGRGSNPQGKAVVATESASAGASSASGIATTMTGPTGKPGTGKPKKIANAHKAKKVTVGKGIY